MIFLTLNLPAFIIGGTVLLGIIVVFYSMTTATSEESQDDDEPLLLWMKEDEEFLKHNINNYREKKGLEPYRFLHGKSDLVKGLALQHVIDEFDDIPIAEQWNPIIERMDLVAHTFDVIETKEMDIKAVAHRWKSDRAFRTFLILEHANTAILHIVRTAVPAHYDGEYRYALALFVGKS